MLHVMLTCKPHVLLTYFPSQPTGQRSILCTGALLVPFVRIQRQHAPHASTSCGSVCVRHTDVRQAGVPLQQKPQLRPALDAAVF